MRLLPLQLQLEREPGALRPQILQALAAHGRPLRWAITGTTPLEGGSCSLQIEAVVLV
jgi:hypothetical protein